MSTFDHAHVELTAVPAARLDGGALSALVVAAAGAIGMPPHGPPIVQQGIGTLAVGLICREGHIVLHAAPADGVCLVDIVTRPPAAAARGLDVIRRRLAPTVA
jgi:hypothetical protein